MAQIVPAILEETKEAFDEKVSKILKLPDVKRIQVDFGDGLFIQKCLLGPGSMELNPAFEWEAHLMVKNPEDFLDYKIAGFNIVLLHYEAFENLDGLFLGLNKAKNQALKVGVVLNPGTPVEVVKDFAGQASQILLMGVHPGKQGQEFLPQTVERVKLLRKMLPNAIIEVDGGVSLDNAKELSAAGADLLVVGSALVKAAEIVLAWDKLRAAAN